MSVNKKLDRLMWMERAKNALILLVIGVPVAIVISLLMVSMSGVNNFTEEQVTGVLHHYKLAPRDDGSVQKILHVQLEDGTIVTARTSNIGTVGVGEPVELVKRTRTRGATSYHLPIASSSTD